jgi:hypothetical protein
MAFEQDKVAEIRCRHDDEIVHDLGCGELGCELEAPVRPELGQPRRQPS